MAENENPEQPAETIPVADAVAETVAAEETPVVSAVAPAAVSAALPAAPAPRLRDHLFSFRSVIAVGVATLLLGGAGGAAVVALADDGHDDRPRLARPGEGPGRFGGQQDRPGGGFAPPGFRQDGPRDAPDGGSPDQDSQPGPGSSS